jgi:hypothetical protein
MPATLTLKPTRTPTPTTMPMWVLGGDDGCCEVSFVEVGPDRMNVTSVYRGTAGFPKFLTKAKARDEWRRLTGRGFRLLEHSRW